jgi:cellulose synthase/poly-beta-1,6-N-acetylglucosamine synthase-like glycosyltransferase
MELKNYLTIVIPCKNENKVIDQTLTLLNYQESIEGVKVIVSDSSDDETTVQLKQRISDKFDLEIIQGGLPGKARNNGVKITKTPYILFMDSDIFILDNKLIKDLLLEVIFYDYHLATTKFKTTNGKYNFVFRFFDFVQKLTKGISPFCLGGFMLIKRSEFNKIGGFDESVMVAEDYLLSKQIEGNKFFIDNKTLFTPPRRFSNKGIWFMLKLMIKSYFNRNNKEFFSNFKSYWNE